MALVPAEVVAVGLIAKACLSHVNIILLIKLLLKLEAATKKNYFLHKKFSFIPKITLY